MKKVINKCLIDKFWREVGTFLFKNFNRSPKLQQKIALLTNNNFISY